MTSTNTPKYCRFFSFRLTILASLLSLCAASVSAQNFVVITNLVSFNGTNGQQPSGPLLQAKDGNLYGTVLYGGTNAAYAGSIFRLTTSGALSNPVFFNGTNGANPSSGLIQGADGNLYGTTAYGGAFITNDSNHIGFGTVFKTTTNGAMTNFASFDGTNGKSPNALLEITPGVFIGSANSGGAFSNFAGFGYGTLFKAGTNTVLTNFLSFNDTNGAGPSAGLTMTTNGVIFGTTTSGGSNEYGTIFRLATDGSVAAEFIFDFTNGAVPGALIPGRDGNLYGTTAFGGSNQLGTIFKLTTNLVLTTLFSFNGTNGDAPGSLIQGNDGNFYGVTSQGGAKGFGNVFELTTNGVLIPLYEFSGGSDGYAGVSLIQGTDGNYYGTTSYGGDAGRGNVFKLSVIPIPTIQRVSMNAHSTVFTWPAVSNLTYDVQYVTNLSQTNWSLLKSVTASNAQCTMTDPIGGPGTQRFYRISFHQ